MVNTQTLNSDFFFRRAGGYTQASSGLLENKKKIMSDKQFDKLA